MNQYLRCAEFQANNRNYQNEEEEEERMVECWVQTEKNIVSSELKPSVLGMLVSICFLVAHGDTLE